MIVELSFKKASGTIRGLPFVWKIENKTRTFDLRLNELRDKPGI